MANLSSELFYRSLRRGWSLVLIVTWTFLFFSKAVSLSGLSPAQAVEEIDDITSEYHFLSADDTLALLEEDGKLKGYIDIFQPEEESDTVLSYTIVSGWRKKDQVEFKTNKIHQKYYRFTGTVERGEGHEVKDRDYLRLIGDLEIITVKAGIDKESVERRRVVFKSIGKKEREED